MTYDKPMTTPSEQSTPPTEITASGDAAGARLDKWLSEQIADLSRSRAKALIEEGQLSLNGAPLLDPRAKIVADATYTLTLPPPAPATPEPENIPLDILFEDEHLIILNKPAGIVVHPTPGQWTGTLVNALLHHCGDSLTGIGASPAPASSTASTRTHPASWSSPRPNPSTPLSSPSSAHDIERAYLAVTRGAPRPLIGRIETRIARSPHDRKKMAVVKERYFRRDAHSDDPDANEADEREHGKHAVTNYRTLETFGRLDASGTQPASALVECRLETGRTHQIRVHLAHIGAPVMGDPTYGKNRGVKATGKGPAFDHAVETARTFRRQALHARILGFIHPATGEELRFEAPPPDDMRVLIEALHNMDGS